MTTPICDFVRRYAESNALRLHMPGHKGKTHFGPEIYDITEIYGADSLYEADGIIRESESNASALFGADTFYSAEGSSLSIRAMLYLATLYAREQGKRPLIVAGRNAHKVFLSAAALLDFDVLWLYPEGEDSYLSCKIQASAIDKMLFAAEEKPTALYLTSPDYLGNTVDVAAIARVCHKHGVLMLVDNAHGAYQKFLPESRHPIDLGADMCSDSAHKTLPALTGSAYLHVSKNAPSIFAREAKNALALFGSTSPSYLILQSLDALNAYIADGYREKLAAFLGVMQKCKDKLTSHGYVLVGDEPLKLTVAAKPYGYSGGELSALLLEKNIVSEFADPDFLVLMLTPELSHEEIKRLTDALLSIEKREAINECQPRFHMPSRAMSIREAMLSPREVIPASESCGRVLSSANVGCPPAVPIVVSGERIDADALKCFKYYGIKECTVIK